MSDYDNTAGDASATAKSYLLGKLASMEAEHSLLGALLLDNNAWDRCGDTVRAEHFFNPTNRLIFEEISRQVNALKACDVVTVGIALKGQVSMEELAALAQYVPSAANVRRYAATIVERFKSRQLMAVSSELVELSQDHARPIEDRVEDAQGQLVKLIDQNPRDDWVSAETSIAKHMDVLTDRADGVTNAMPTGLHDLDDYLNGGLRPGSLIIIGARPSMGKTALAVTIGIHMARDYSVGMVSMEMPQAELSDRMIASVGRVDLSTVQMPNKGKGLDWSAVTAAVDTIRSLNFHITDQSGLNINQVRTKARQLKRVHGLHVLVVDYIGLMSGLDSRQPRAYQLEEISRGLKTLAKELDIAVVCLAQVNRKVEERADQMPGLSDLRDSGAIEQDADVVIFVHRPIQVRPDMGPEWRNYAKCGVAKNRQGRCGVLDLSYIGEQTRFCSWQGDSPSRATAFSSKGREL